MPEGYKLPQKGDIQLPNESGKRDPRLPAKKTSSLDALKGIVSDSQQTVEEFKRRQRR